MVRPSFVSAVPVAVVATAGAAFYAVAMIWLRRIGPGESHEAVVFHFSLVALSATMILALPVWRWPDRRSGLLLLGAGIGGVLTHLFAIPAFGDQPGAWQVAGSVLVIAASLLLAADHEPVADRVRASS